MSVKIDSVFTLVISDSHKCGFSLHLCLEHGTSSYREHHSHVNIFTFVFCWQVKQHTYYWVLLAVYFAIYLSLFISILSKNNLMWAKQEEELCDAPLLCSALKEDLTCLKSLRCFQVNDFHKHSAGALFSNIFFFKCKDPPPSLAEGRMGGLSTTEYVPYRWAYLQSFSWLCTDSVMSGGRAQNWEALWQYSNGCQKFIKDFDGFWRSLFILN